MNDTVARTDADAVLRAIRTRRVVRALTAEPVARADVAAVVESARFAPRAGNRRIHLYVAVTDPALLRGLRMVSPGMLQVPTAAVVICVDWDRARRYGFAPTHPGAHVDVGTAAATMLLAAHALGLGAGPVTSFSSTAAATLLGLPEPVRPELIVCLGHPVSAQTPPLRVRPGNAWADVVRWDRGAATHEAAAPGQAAQGPRHAQP
ncbi:nitroreductase family protein [Streptomyces bambusae]|uniref:nitroreductase family protein n=1 Tax=Streptomyces bambusae TaxID=1550616 RepID=UPI001CFD555D|nr:nitroreductase family protein [Streptomyces bambusae]MCB5164656.1 nitroreductase family protein [Streptomyces bambusae]